MTVNVNTGFDNNDRLLDIRQVVLNPIAVKVASLEDKMNIVKPLAEQAFTTTHVDIDNKTIEFHSEQGGSVVNLDGMFGEGSDLTVVDGEGKTETKVKEIKLTDSLMIKDTQGGVEMMYDWSKIVKANQDDFVVGKTGAGVGSPTKSIFFKGPSVSVTQTTPDITTVEFPEIPKQLMAQLSSASSPEAIDSILIDGNIGTSAILNGKLTIDLPTGGGVTPLSNQNFLGFFDTLGDLESFIQNPVDGKSFAFVKDSKLGGAYYTPYFYISSSWKELKQDPALTYEDPKAPNPVGVFSIKPSEKIKVDDKGQLDLDGLSTPQIPSHFKGFFESIQDLKNAVPNPIHHQDWAYVRNSSTGGLLGYRADKQGTAILWNPIAPMGSLAVIDRSTNPPSYAQSFGIEKGDSWTMDSKGILSLKPIDTKTRITISGYDGAIVGGEINKIKFETGKSYASVSGDELVLKNPQRVITYNGTWESNHNTEDYRGNLFYDITSRTWMGWSDPEAAGGVDVKWTRLFHRNMSPEVKDLSKRLPAKTASVQPGVLDDNPAWSYNGITYLEKDSDQLPEDLKMVCGGYITTSVQDKDDPGVTIAQHRLQTCVADRESGGTWVRRYISTSSPGSSVFWSPWIRTSFSYKDIEDHQKDTSAHKEVIRFYKVVSLLGNIKSILSQTTGGALGGFHADNRMPLGDNYGFTGSSELDYLNVPYDGNYRLRGFLSFSGYADNTRNYPLGTWQLLFRKKEVGTQNYAPVGQFRYEHTDKSKPFPVISFLAESFSLGENQELVTNLTFSDPSGISHNHPGLYIVPSRSFMALEDVNTKAGSGLARAMRLLLGNLDTIGDVAIKSHHATLTDPKSQIRVYGESVNKTPVVMTSYS